MGDMWDAVTWTNIQGKAGAKAGYIDGSISMWPPEAWQAFQGDPTLHITVLASEDGEAFDVEAGNASADAAAGAMANRKADGKWSVLYTNQDGIDGCIQSLARKGLQLQGAESFPGPGVYLWAADPSGNIAAGRWHLPVTPVAVQDAFADAFDHSATHPAFLASQSPPEPPAPLPEVTVNVPEVSEQNPGPNVSVPWVASVQAILTARHGAGLAIDGRFGPATNAAVRQFQQVAGIAVDGIVGPDTAQHLCNT